MEITVEINDTLKEAVGRVIYDIVDRQVNKLIVKYEGSIQDAVNVYLEKRLTDKEIKSEIDAAVSRIIEDKLRYIREE